MNCLSAIPASHSANSSLSGLQQRALFYLRENGIVVLVLVEVVHEADHAFLGRAFVEVEDLVVDAYLLAALLLPPDVAQRGLVITD